MRFFFKTPSPLLLTHHYDISICVSVSIVNAHLTILSYRLEEAHEMDFPMTAGR